MPFGSRRHTQAVPGCAAVGSDLATCDGLLHDRECSAHSLQEFLVRHGAGLLLGVVQVVHVDGPQSEVLAALCEAVAEKARRKRMPAGNELFAMENLRIEKLPLQIRLILLSAARRRRVERYVSTFRAHDQLVPTDRACPNRLLNRRAADALSPLAAVVDRRVDDVDALLQRVPDRRPVRGIDIVRAVAEVSTDADRRGVNPARLAKIVRLEYTVEARAVARRSVCRCPERDRIHFQRGRTSRAGRGRHTLTEVARAVWRRKSRAASRLLAAVRRICLE